MSQSFASRNPGVIRRRRLSLVSVSAFAVLTAVSACSSGGATPAASQSPSANGAVIDGAVVKADPALAQQVPAAVKSQGLVDVTYNDAPPDELVTNGQLVGWEVDIGRAVAATLGLKWTAVASGAFDEFIPGLQNGRYNSSFTSFIYTPARVTQIDIVTYYDVGTGFAVHSGSSIHISKPTDLCGKTVSVIAGSAFIEQLNGIDPSCAAAHLQPVHVASFPSDAAAELAVSSGRDEIYSTSEDQLSWLIQQTEHQFVLQPLDYMPVPEGAGVSKSAKITNLIAGAINELIKSGAYAKIMHHWSLNSGLVTSAGIYS
jgi:polar amino acid transport system substrate-binding protein